MFNKILVVFDATESNSCVVTIALAYARLFKAHLFLLHTAPLSESDSYRARSAIKTQREEAVSLAKLRSLQETATSMGLTVECTAFEGQMGDELWQLAQQWEADLIILEPRTIAESQAKPQAFVQEGHIHHLQPEVTDSAASLFVNGAPCSILLVQRPVLSNTISMRMILKPKREYDQAVRNRLEALLALTPDE